MNDERQPPCSSFIFHRSSFQRCYGWHILVPAPRQIQDNHAFERTAVAQQPSEGMRRLERRNDALHLAQLVERFERQVIAAVVVLDAPGALQLRVFRYDGGVIESRRDGMCLGDLAELVLQHNRSRAVQDADRAAAEPRRMLPEIGAAPAGLYADQADRLVLQHLVEESDRIRSAADAGHGGIRQPSSALAELSERLAPDDRLKVAHHHRIRMRAQDGAEDVVRGANVGDPIANRFVDRILQRPASAGNGNDLGAQESHTEDVQLLASHIDFAHVDNALQAEQRAGGGSGYAVLAGAGLGDDALLAHPPGDEGLSEGVVDLVRAGVIEILALQKESEGSAQLGESQRLAERRRATDVILQNVIELPPKGAIASKLAVGALEFVEGGHQCVRDSLADAERLHHWQSELPRLVIGFAALELHQIEPDEIADLADVVARGIAKDADDLRALLAALADFRRNRHRPLRLDEARRGGDEDETEEVGALVGTKERVVFARQSTNLDLGHGYPGIKARTAAARSFCRNSDSPTKNAWKPAAASRATSPELLMPLSATLIAPFGIAAPSRSEVARSTPKSRRLRLFTPITRAPPSIARSSSRSSCTSTRASHPKPSNSAMKRRIVAASSSDARRRMAFACAATPPRSCVSSMTKSFIRMGRAERAAREIQSREPRKNSGSVTMEIAAAPPRAYSPAIDSTSGFSMIAPAEGDAALISAMTLILGPASAFENAKGLRSGSGVAGGGSSRSRARVRATICSRKSLIAPPALSSPRSTVPASASLSRWRSPDGPGLPHRGWSARRRRRTAPLRHWRPRCRRADRSPRPAPRARSPHSCAHRRRERPPEAVAEFRGLQASRRRCGPGRTPPRRCASEQR